MSLLLKIILGVIGLAVLLGGAFYLWLVVAYTPPQPAEKDFVKLVKQGTLDGVAYVITWKAANPDAPRTYDVASGLIKDGNGTSVWLRVSGKPVPVDLKLDGDKRIEVFFDGPLPDGFTSMRFDMDEGYRRGDFVELENGKRVTSR